MGSCPWKTRQGGGGGRRVRASGDRYRRTLKRIDVAAEISDRDTTMYREKICISVGTGAVLNRQFNLEGEEQG